MREKQNPKDPAWWNEDHARGWDRVKEALKRDWEQTKSDLVSTQGQDLDQQVGDTVKQAAGREPIPAPGHRNHSIDFDDYELAYRYGYGARQQYGQKAESSRSWDPELEERLEQEWFAMGDQQSWIDARPHVRRGWETSRRS